MHLGKKVFYSTPPRKATEKSRVLGTWISWLSVNLNFAATMKMATIISTFLNENTSTDHASL
jgi:hypothetical protein